MFTKHLLAASVISNSVLFRVSKRNPSLSANSPNTPSTVVLFSSNASSALDALTTFWFTVVMSSFGLMFGSEGNESNSCWDCTVTFSSSSAKYLSIHYSVLAKYRLISSFARLMLLCVSTFAFLSWWMSWSDISLGSLSYAHSCTLWIN